MALNEEIIKRNEQLASLTPEQISAIAELSAADENNVIGARISKVYTDLDTDILNSSGVQKNQGEKTYDYLKRSLSQFKAMAEPNAQKIADLEAEKLELQKQIKDGSGDATLRQQLADTQTMLESLKAQHATEKSEYEKRMENIRYSYAFDSAKAGISLKAAYSDTVKNSLFTAAKTELESKYKVEVDAQGAVLLRNKETGVLELGRDMVTPKTLNDFLKDFLKDDIEEKGKGGAGTDPNQPPLDNLGDIADLTLAKTQIQASDAIDAYLAKKGLLRHDMKFVEEKNKLWKENKIDKLPVQ